jgi:hypothetical protein
VLAGAQCQRQQLPLRQLESLRGAQGERGMSRVGWGVCDCECECVCAWGGGMVGGAKCARLALFKNAVTTEWGG